MTKVIRYIQGESEFIINPSPFCDLTIEEIAEKDVPEGCPWVIINLEDLPAPPEPTPEELQAQMPALTPRQFRDALIDADIMPDQITAAISQIPDAKQRAKAFNAWEYPTQFSRTDPLIDQIGAMFSLTPEQIDAMWQQALND